MDKKYGLLTLCYFDNGARVYHYILLLSTITLLERCITIIPVQIPCESTTEVSSLASAMPTSLTWEHFTGKRSL